MVADQIIPALGLIGLGGLIKTTVDYFIGQRKVKADARHLFKEKRYKAILLLGFAYVNYETEKITLIINRPDITTHNELRNELEAEYINMLLYASDTVVIKMKVFLRELTKSAFDELILSMRKDLYGIKTKLQVGTFDI
ncbi:MAG: hypothetical protein JWQ09_817 [Segetibacter sp.]|nr:hypothetical protein [Segetibacter sp.]